jgi:hypothetical protein
VPFAVSEQTFPNAPGTFINEVVLLDLNGDGKLDLVLAGQLLPWEDRGVPVQFFVGDGKGAFALAPQLVSGAVPETEHARQYVLADFNGDGKTDLFLADHGYDAAPS